LLLEPPLLKELTEPPNILVDPLAKSEIDDNEFRIPSTFKAVF
jgi:hypothetical protein